MPTTRVQTSSVVYGLRVICVSFRFLGEVGGGGGWTTYMSISTEGSGMPTTRLQASSLVYGLRVICVSFRFLGEVGGGGGELFTCPYPLKVQTHPPLDCRPALWSTVSGHLPVKFSIYMKGVIHFLLSTSIEPAHPGRLGATSRWSGDNSEQLR